MRNRLFGVFGVFSLILMAFPSTVFAQGKVSILFSPTFLPGKFNVIRDDLGLKDMNAKKFAPGVEVRFNQSGKVAFGVSFNRFELDQKPAHRTVMGTMEGQEIVGIDSTGKAEVNTVVGSIYFSTDKGKVRPFAVAGGGINLIEVTTNYSWVVAPGYDPSWAISPDDRLPNPTESQIRPAIKGMGGVNFFPVKNIVISVSAGYFNGPAVGLAAGFTF